MNKRPNIVLILIDDLGARDLSCYGSSFYETPVLDRLARQGARFERAYASCPVCSPTRASILSGKYPARIGVTQYIGANSRGRLCDVPYLHYLPLEEYNLARALGDNGYQTWHVGKWHLGDEDFYPDRQGFEVNLGGFSAGHPRNGYFSPWDFPTLPDGPEGEYLTDALTDRAIELVRQRRDAPFFLNLCHYAVHTPIQAPKALVEKYRQKARRLKLDQVDPIVPGEHFATIHKQDLRVERRVIQSDPTYAAMIENLDTNIGRLLQALEDEGIADDTLIIFTSDNGGLATAEGSPTCNLPLAEGKGWCEEGGLRVCQLMRWPGVIPAGSSCDTPVTSTDFYPTVLEAAGLPPIPEQHCDGVSLLPMIRGESPCEREAIFWHYPHYSNQGGLPGAAIMAGDWKLIECFESGKARLYHLASDPSETTDLSSREPERCAQLRARLRAWQEEIEARFPEPNPDYEREYKRPRIPNNAWE